MQIVDGISNYKIRITDTDKKRTIYVTHYLWCWLPFSRLGGKASKAGLGIFNSNLEKYTDDLAD